MTNPRLINPQVERIVRWALAEDIGHGDLTTDLTVEPGAMAKAHIVAKQDLVLSGLQAARLAFTLVDQAVEFEAAAGDGDRLATGDVVARMSGPAASILTAERAALNFLIHLSGVATLTARFVELLQGGRARLVDTRKTTPGHRVLEKAAVRHGGGFNHRFGLYDGILIKENHIQAAGSITAAVTRARTGAPHTIKVEVEIESLDQLEEALAAGAEAILLDNMNPDQMREAVRRTAGRALLEASGGVSLESAAAIAATGVDLISCGALTHSAPAADLSLRFL